MLLLMMMMMMDCDGEDDENNITPRVVVDVAHRNHKHFLLPSSKIINGGEN